MNSTLRLPLRYLTAYGCLICMALLILIPAAAHAAPTITATPAHGQHLARNSKPPCN